MLTYIFIVLQEVGFTHSTSQSNETSLPDTEDGPAVLEIEVTQMTKL